MSWQFKTGTRHLYISSKILPGKETLNLPELDVYEVGLVGETTAVSFFVFDCPGSKL